MTANQGSTPDNPESRPKPPEAAEDAGHEGREAHLSYNEIFTADGKEAKPSPAEDDKQTKPEPPKTLSTPHDSQLSSHLLTKELARDLISSKEISSANLSQLKTIPGQTFVSAQGLRTFQMGRKADYKAEEKPRFRASKDLSEKVSPPPLAEPQKRPTKKDGSNNEDKQEKPESELEVDDIYTDLIVKSPTKLLHDEQVHDLNETKPHSIFDQMEHVRPHDLGALGEQRIVKARLRQCIENLSHGRLIVVGDLLIDELLEGSPRRISREAPVLILEHVDTELIPGGAANTAHNVAALGGHCHAVGVSGTDEYAHKLEVLLEKHHIAHSLVRDPSRPTTVKTRILSKAHSLKQQLLRLDRISHATIDSAVQMLIVQKLQQLAKGFNGIILSDYRAGVICQNVISGCRQFAQQNNLTMVVDAQEGFERFQDVDLITPNQPDAENAVGFEFIDDNTLFRGGKELLTITGSKAILITRGANGMSLFRQDTKPFHLPVFNRSEVFDVTGAGDTVVATMALAMVTGSSLEEATALGNLAAGIVVRKSGTAVTTQQEMIENLERLHFLAT